MTHEELDQIETNLRKVESVFFNKGDYGLMTALELAAELRKHLPSSSALAVGEIAYSQSGAFVAQGE